MPKSKDSFKTYYVDQAKQRGGNLPAFHGATFQHGYGLGSMLRGLFRWAVPHVNAGLKSLGRHALKGGLAVAGDIASGQDFKKSLKTRVKEAGKAAVNEVVSDQSGSGRKSTKRRSTPKPVTSRQTKKQKTSRKQEFDFFSQ